MTTGLRIECAGLTDVGRKREHNEDSLLLAPRHGLLMVADGLGGLSGGEVASNLAVATLEQFYDSFEADPEVTMPFRHGSEADAEAERLVAGLKAAHWRIRETADSNHRDGMGTTCVAILVDGARAHIAWVGDSRAYLWRRGSLRQLTFDHSLVNELIRDGSLRPDEVDRFPRRNAVTRALGATEVPELEVRTIDLEPGDLLLACTDGLTGMVDDESIALHLSAGLSLEDTTQRLINAANTAGGSDNITVALGRYLG